MKKVLFVTTRLIYPVNDGRKVVLYNYCKGLAEQHNCEVSLFSFVDENEYIDQPTFLNDVHLCKSPSKIEKLKNLIVKSIVKREWPLQVSLYYSKKAQKKLNRVISEYKPDIVIADMARTAEYLKQLDNCDYRKILDMDDIISKRYRRQLKSGTMGIDIIGAYSKKLPNSLKGLLNNKKIAEFILEKEIELLSKYEVSISKYYEKIIFVSPVEAAEFNKKIDENKCLDITIGVDYDYFSKSKADHDEEKCIVFLGNMYVAHNKDAVNKFIDEIFPIILKDIPEAKFRIVGRCPEEYKVNLSKIKNIEVSGEVEDIRSWVQSSTVAVAPLTYGSGIKTKILETMAMGVPVVTNYIGVEGISTENDKNIIVREASKEIAEEIIKLLKDTEYRKLISNEARAFISENHRWSEILKKFEDIL